MSTEEGRRTERDLTGALAGELGHHVGPPAVPKGEVRGT